MQESRSELRRKALQKGGPMPEFETLDGKPAPTSADLTANDVIEELRHKAFILGTQSGLARMIGISASHLGDILAGKRAIGQSVLTFLRLEKVVAYRKLDDGGQIANNVDDDLVDDDLTVAGETDPDDPADFGDFEDDGGHDE